VGDGVAVGIGEGVGVAVGVHMGVGVAVGTGLAVGVGATGVGSTGVAGAQATSAISRTSSNPPNCFITPPPHQTGQVVNSGICAILL
jgi:hypothetical protein